MRSDAARNRDRILEVARDLISREGPTVSMDTIAAEAGVAVGTLYRHHPTKAALVEAVIGQSIEQLAQATLAAQARVEQGAPAGDEAAALFRLVADRHAIDQAVKEAAVALGAHAPMPQPGADPGFHPDSSEQRAWDAIAALLAAAQREGSVRADLTPADLLALLAGVPAQGVPATVRDRYVDVVIAGMRAVDASP